MSSTCPDRGRLRLSLDPEATRSDRELADHLTACATCQSTLENLRHDAGVTADALESVAGSTPTTPETELALARFHRALSGVPTADFEPALTGAVMAASRSTAPAPAASTPAPALATVADAPSTAPPHHDPTPRRIPVPIVAVGQRWRLAIGGLAAALALTLALATPEGQVVAATFLSQFRSQRLAVVTFDPGQARQTGLFRLERLGTLQNGQPPRPAEVGTLKQAQDLAHFPILQPDPSKLPPGASTTPKIRVSPGAETRLTFDRQKTREYFDSINRKDLALPDRLHGSTLVIQLPPIVMLEYPAADNRPAVMVGQARELAVGVEGAASLDEVRSFVLGLPDLPPDLARQLRAIPDWTNTLPIPVPVDKVAWKETTVSGAPALILDDTTGLGSGVIWQRDGGILGVAGPMKSDALKQLAESLH
jgi:hypothetical protein